MAKAVIKEANDSRLHQYFNGSDFRFFDKTGNFIGENLKVSEEILYRIRNTFVDGKTLELELEQPPTGYTFGTVISTVAALMRAGKIIAKYNGETKYSWKDNGVIEIFSAAREFRKASFKAVSKSLSLQQRQELAQFLIDIEAEKYIDRQINYNTNDFELVDAIRSLAKHFIDKVTTLQNSEKEFDKLFRDAEAQKALLAIHSGPVSEANYIDKAKNFLASKGDFEKAIKTILKIEKFIRNKLPKVKEWKTFVIGVRDEFKKSAEQDSDITQLIDSFEEKYIEDIVGNYSGLNEIAQKVKDRYYTLFSEEMKVCAEKYSKLKQEAEKVLKEIKSLPAGLNSEAEAKIQNIKSYAEQRTKSDIELDFDIKDKNSRFTYSEVVSFVKLYETQKNELEILKVSLIKEKPKKEDQGQTKTTKKIIVTIPNKKLSVAEYRKWLTEELRKLASANDEDEIEFK